MKTMKNVLMILLGAALVLSLAGVGAVAADDIADTDTFDKKENGYDWDKDGTITVSYTIGASYSVTIPADVDLKANPEDNGQTVIVSATLDPNKKLTVYVESDNTWEMLIANTASGTGIKYAMNYDGKTVTTTGQKKVELYNTSTNVPEASAKSIGISFTTISTQDEVNMLPAGEYTDTLTFEVVYE